MGILYIYFCVRHGSGTCSMLVPLLPLGVLTFRAWLIIVQETQRRIEKDSTQGFFQSNPSNYTQPHHCKNQCLRPYRPHHLRSV